MEPMAAREGATSSRRRRDRQLRALHRHERLTVRMGLATALHHGSQRPKTVEEPEEVESHETYYVHGDRSSLRSALVS